MKTAVVTGGTGFVGHALISELAQNGIPVLAICRPDSPKLSRISGIQGVTILEKDIGKTFVLPSGEYNTFYHLAWGGGRDNFTEQFTNINVAVNCFHIAANAGCCKFFAAGSQAEYGETDEFIDEETPLLPTTSYGSCKVAAHFLLRDLARKAGMKYIWGRIFSVYGENDHPHTLFSQLLKAFRNNKDFSPSTNCNHMWNFIHETDVARAIRLLGETDDVACGVYNIASSMSRPLRKYVETLQTVLKSSSNILYGELTSKVCLNTTAEKLRNAIGEFERTEFPGLN